MSSHHCLVAQLVLRSIVHLCQYPVMARVRRTLW